MNFRTCDKCEECCEGMTPFRFIGDYAICDACYETLTLEEKIGYSLSEYSHKTPANLIAEDMHVEFGCRPQTAMALINKIKGK